MIQNNSSLITLKNAGIFRSGRWLVRGVNLTVNSGEILTLIGLTVLGNLQQLKWQLEFLSQMRELLINVKG